jgi:hypothetical protein
MISLPSCRKHVSKSARQVRLTLFCIAAPHTFRHATRPCQDHAPRFPSPLTAWVGLLLCSGHRRSQAKCKWQAADVGQEAEERDGRGLTSSWAPVAEGDKAWDQRCGSLAARATLGVIVEWASLTMPRCRLCPLISPFLGPGVQRLLSACRARRRGHGLAPRGQGAHKPARARIHTGRL